MFKFDESNRLSVGGTGKEFTDFKAKFGNEERGFGYIRIKVINTYMYTIGEHNTRHIHISELIQKDPYSFLY